MSEAKRRSRCRSERRSARKGAKRAGADSGRDDPALIRSMERLRAFDGILPQAGELNHDTSWIKPRKKPWMVGMKGSAP